MNVEPAPLSCRRPSCSDRCRWAGVAGAIAVAVSIVVAGATLAVGVGRRGVVVVPRRRRGCGAAAGYQDCHARAAPANRRTPIVMSCLLHPSGWCRLLGRYGLVRRADDQEPINRLLVLLAASP